MGAVVDNVRRSVKRSSSIVIPVAIASLFGNGATGDSAQEEVQQALDR